MNKLSFREKYSYGIGALGKDLAYAIVSSYLMIYFTDAIGLNPAFVGVLFLVARMWDAFNDPMMGMVVDNTRSKWGKFRPWILIGTVVNAAVIVFLFKKPNLEGNALYVYYSVMYILWGMTYTIMDIPYWSMIPSLSSDKEEREKISVIPRIFASSAWLLMGAFGLSLIDKLVVFIGIVLFMNLIMQIIGGVSLYYFKYVIGNDKLNQVFYAFSGLAEIGGLMLFPILTKKIGRQDVFKVGSVLPILGCSMLLVFGIIAPKNAAFIAVSGIVLKLGTGMLLGATTVMLADVVDYGQFKLGTRNESIVFSVQTLLVKTASAVSGWLVGVGLSVVGYVPNAEQGASTILGLRVLMIGLPILCAVLMYVIYKQKYKINGKFHDMILNELKNKKDKEAVI